MSVILEGEFEKSMFLFWSTCLFCFLNTINQLAFTDKDTLNQNVSNELRGTNDPPSKADTRMEKLLRSSNEAGPASSDKRAHVEKASDDRLGGTKSKERQSPEWVRHPALYFYHYFFRLFLEIHNIHFAADI